jgi:hypothetical protein
LDNQHPEYPLHPKNPVLIVVDNHMNPVDDYEPVMAEDVMDFLVAD